MEQGDVIGVLFEKNENNEFYSLSFSRNGKNFGVAYDDIQFKNNMRFVAHLGFHFLFIYLFIYLFILGVNVLLNSFLMIGQKKTTNISVKQ